MSAFPVGTVVRVVVRSCGGHALLATGQAIWYAGGPHAPALTHGMHGISQVPGQPSCARPALGPRGGLTRQAIRRAGTANAFRTTLAHPNWSFRGSITRLSYSLSTLRGLDCSRTRARLASGWWPAFAGQAFSLRGCSGRFLCHGLSATFPPPPGFAWRDQNDRLCRWQSGTKSERPLARWPVRPGRPENGRHGSCTVGARRRHGRLPGPAPRRA